jgi:hypothetical protein
VRAVGRVRGAATRDREDHSAQTDDCPCPPHLVLYDAERLSVTPCQLSHSRFAHEASAWRFLAVKVSSPDDHDVTSGNLCIKGRFGYRYVQGGKG